MRFLLMIQNLVKLMTEVGTRLQGKKSLPYVSLWLNQRYLSEMARQSGLSHRTLMEGWTFIIIKSYH